MRPLIMAAALLLAACLEPAPPGATAGSAPGSEGPSGPWVEVGGGREGFEVLEVGQAMEVERGPQGGQHIWASLRTWGIDAGSEDDYEAMLNGDRPVVEFQLENSEGILSFVNSFPRRLEPTEQASHELLGRLVQFRHWAEVPEDWAQIDWGERELQLEQEEMLLRVVLEEADGDVFVDECPVYLDFPPREQGATLAAQARP